MIIQIINLSLQDVFKKFSDEYKIFRDVYYHGLYGLEIKSISDGLASIVQKIILHQKEICYKKNNREKTDLFITGTINSFKEISRKIVSSGDEDLGYRIVNVIKNFEEYGTQSYVFGKRTLIFDNPLIMGILNVTPDSFSDGGKFIDLDAAIAHADLLINEGADIIDIGGESTRPGSDPVPVDEELNRTIPVVRYIKKKYPDAVVSIDTTKSEVAKKALESGASIVNDISALTFDNNMASVIKAFDAGIVLMHIKGTPKNMQDKPSYEDVTGEVYTYLYQQIGYALKKGIKKIIVDPGIGFGKTVEHNFDIIRRLEDFRSLGYPIMIGLSRKSFIGKTLDLDVNERDVPTTVLESISINNSARVIRTHNVKLAKQTTRLLKYLI